MPKLLSDFDARAAIAASALFFFGGVLPSAAEQNIIKPLVRPDRASITVPDLTLMPTRVDISDDDTYYYFYKVGVSYEVAFADLDECRMYTLATKLLALPPKFVPLGSDVIREHQTPVLTQFGIGGMIIGGILIEQAEEDNARATTNRCMAYKGYYRYGTSSDIWDKINAGSDTEKFARMALIASGPQPAAETVAP